MTTPTQERPPAAASGQPWWKDTKMVAIIAGVTVAVLVVSAVAITSLGSSHETTLDATSADTSVEPTAEDLAIDQATAVVANYSNLMTVWSQDPTVGWDGTTLSGATAVTTGKQLDHTQDFVWTLKERGVHRVGESTYEITNATASENNSRVEIEVCINSGDSQVIDENGEPQKLLKEFNETYRLKPTKSGWKIYEADITYENDEPGCV